MSQKRWHYYLHEQLQAKIRTPELRSKGFVSLLALVAVYMACWACWKQVWNPQASLRPGERRFLRNHELPAKRGSIVDRNGLLLADSVPAIDVWMIPDYVKRDNDGKPTPEVQKKLKELAVLLDVPLEVLHSRLTLLGEKYVELKRRVPFELKQAILDLDIQGVHTDNVYRRAYPEGAAAAHVIGHVKIDWSAAEGVERTFHRTLSGRPGMHRYLVDNKKRTVDSLAKVEPMDGENVTLSIDARLQSFADRALCTAVAEHKAQAGSLIALDARTGEILAMANCPSYDPYWVAGILEARKKFNKDSLRNRAITDVFEPGSTMKPFTVAMALELGRVRTDTVVDTSPGYFDIEDGKKKRRVRDTHNFGKLTVEGVIEKSSNVGAIKISRLLSAQEMWNTYIALGYGRAPKVEYPRPLSGIVHPWANWSPADKDVQSYGYRLSATLLQVARAYTVFANDGRLQPLTLLKTESAPEGEKVFSPQTTSQVRHMLGLATGPRGTGQRAQIKGYKVGGKSGTARKHKEGYGYVEGAYRSWFVGLAPLENPRVIVAVLIDEPNAGQIYGGAVAAPVFSKVAQQALHLMDVQPNLAIQPQFSSDPVLEPIEGG